MLSTMGNRTANATKSEGEKLIVMIWKGLIWIWLSPEQTSENARLRMGCAWQYGVNEASLHFVVRNKLSWGTYSSVALSNKKQNTQWSVSSTLSYSISFLNP